MDLAQTRALMAQFKIQPTRSLGQNFLVDERVVSRILAQADLEQTDCVLEIGPGLGHLTVALAERAGRVLAVEMNRHILPALAYQLRNVSNVHVIHADARHLDFQALVAGWPGPIKVVANLPYSVTTDLMLKLLTEIPFCQRLILMVQKEAAERFMARPGSKASGPVSILAACLGQLRRVLTVSRGSYYPQPHVDSVVLELTPLKDPLVRLQDLSRFSEFLALCFCQRRKTLLNNLSGSAARKHLKPQCDPLKLSQVLQAIGVGRQTRAEELTPAQFAKLYYSILEISKSM
jgi:16S rRNA (adenine1518-N6/adenine1519-N6)-dimethyltransferase